MVAIGEVMNVHEMTTQTDQTAARVSPLLLAVLVSALAALVAVTANVVFGVGETPLVIGTLVVASVVGWVNAERSARSAQFPVDGGHTEIDLGCAA